MGFGGTGILYVYAYAHFVNTYLSCSLISSFVESEGGLWESMLCAMLCSGIFILIIVMVSVEQ